MDQKAVPEDAHELLQHGATAKPLPHRRRGFWSFLLANPLTFSTLLAGTLVAGSCFGFTYWLSKQVFQCPAWALRCSLSDNVQLFANHLNQVQGVVGAIFSLAIAMMAYATCQLAETTLWPALAKNSFSLSNIDYYLATTRGSLSAAPVALIKAREFGHISVLLIVTLIGVLQLANSVVVGHAYSLSNMTTTYYSNHSSGGGIGVGFSQTNPPGLLSGAVGEAVSTYNSWSNEFSDEPLPDYRQYIFDRANLSNVGNFSAKAILADMSVDCFPQPINITAIESDLFWVSVAQPSWNDVLLRIQPKLTVWVDRAGDTSNTSAIVRVMFLAMGGTLENGYQNDAEIGYESVSSLACNVSVELQDSILCTYSDSSACGHSTAVLSELRTLGGPGGSLANLAGYMAAAVCVLGVPVFGAQPVFNDPSQFQSTASTNGSSVGLPFAWTTIWTGPIEPYHYTIDQLEHFLRVGAGALATNIMRHFPIDSSILESTLLVQRLDPGRTWILLMPPALTLGSVLVVGLLSFCMYRASRIPTVRLGTTSEVVISSQTKDINAIVREARTSSSSTPMLSRLKMRYGIVAEGFDGLARKEGVVPFGKSAASIAR